MNLKKLNLREQKMILLVEKNKVPIAIDLYTSYNNKKENSL